MSLLHGQHFQFLSESKKGSNTELQNHVQQLLVTAGYIMSTTENIVNCNEESYRHDGLHYIVQSMVDIIAQ